MKVFTAEFFVNHGKRGGSIRSKEKLAAALRNLELARKKRWKRPAKTSGSDESK
jgi:hypothetical protein